MTEVGYTKIGTLTKVKATLVTYNKIRCQIGDMGVVNTNSYALTVSNNDGVTVSDAVLFLVYNSDCQTCDSVKGTCVYKVNLFSSSVTKC